MVSELNWIVGHILGVCRKLENCLVWEKLTHDWCHVFQKLNMEFCRTTEKQCVFPSKLGSRRGSSLGLNISISWDDLNQSFFFNEMLLFSLKKYITQLAELFFYLWSLMNQRLSSLLSLLFLCHFSLMALTILCYDNGYTWLPWYLTTEFL